MTGQSERPVIAPGRGTLIFSFVSSGGILQKPFASGRNLAALGVLLLAALVFFRKVLFSQEYVFPWDFRHFHVPLAAALSNALKSGQSLFWDPTTYCGRPIFADPQAQLYYPPTDAVLLLSVFLSSVRLAYLLEWQLVLHVFAAGAFTFLLLRRIGLGRPAALCGGLIFELGGFLASQTQHLDAIDSTAWIPLMWTAAWELRLAWSRWWFALLALSGAMCVLAGLPAVSVPAFVSVLLLGALYCVFHKARWNHLVTISLGLLAAGGISAFMLLPAIQLTFLSIAKYRSDWVDGRGLPLQSLVSLILPDHYHIFDLRLYTSPWDPTFLYLYVSLAGLILTLIALCQTSTGRKYWPLALVTILAGVWMFGTLTPFGRVAIYLMPKLVRGSLYPQYTMAVFCLGMACLAAFGLNGLKRLSPAAKYGIVALVALDLIVTGSGRPMNTADTRLEAGFTSNQIGGSEKLLRELRRLTRNTDPPARIDTFQDAVTWSATAPLTRLPTANGYNPMALERLIQVRLSFAKGKRWGAWYQVENLDSPVVDLIGIRYLVTGRPLPKAADSSKWVEAAVFPGSFIYENRHALPRFWLVHQVRAADTPEEATTQIRDRNFDPLQVAIVESRRVPASLASSLGTQDPHPPEDSLETLRYRPGDVNLRVRTARPAFLVSSEAYYPGWRASVDGNNEPLYMTNGAFLGVVIPPGEHRVSLVFAPLITWVSGLVSVVSIVALAVVVMIFRPDGARVSRRGRSSPLRDTRQPSSPTPSRAPAR
jgi:Bacterial membrane protein YfhO